MVYIERELYLKKIRPFYEVDLIKVLTGVRRCGKSILLEQIENEFLAAGVDALHIIKVNFEDLRYEKIRTCEKLNKSRQLAAGYLTEIANDCIYNKIKD